MKRALAVFAALATASLAAPAGAQDGVRFFGVLFDFGPGAGPIESWEMPARFEGSVVVRFETPTGHGTTTWTPGGSGQFSVAEAQTRKGRRMSAFLASTSGIGTSALVERAGGSCADTQSNTFDQAAVTDGRNGVRLALATPGGDGFHLTETRCGGPLSQEIARLLRPASIARPRLLHGGFDIDLRGSAPLASPRMRGTVESSVVVHVGARIKEKPERAEPAGAPDPSRQMTARYSIERIGGSVTTSYAGTGEICDELDSCGAAETLTLRPGGATGGSLDVSVFAPARRPLRDLRTALGLAPGGNRRSLAAHGYGAWTSRTATLGAVLTRDGATACSDVRHTHSGLLQLTTRKGVVTARLSSDIGDIIRTGCPGPSLAGDGAFPTTLAKGTVPLSAFAKRRVVLHLTHGGRPETDGWAGRTRATISVVLRRTKVTVGRF